MKLREFSLEEDFRKLQNQKYRLKRLYGEKYETEEPAPSNKLLNNRITGQLVKFMKYDRYMSLTFKFINKNKKEQIITIEVRYNQRKHLYKTFNFYFNELKSGHYNLKTPVECNFEYKTETTQIYDPLRKKTKKSKTYYLTVIEQNNQTKDIKKEDLVA